MAKYRIVTPAGASFTVAGGGYALESEALHGMDAEIIECAETRTASSPPPGTPMRSTPRACQFTKRMIDALAELQGHRARQRRRGLGRREPRPPRAASR